MDVQSAADDTGLPMLVVRGPFNLVAAPPGRAGKVGMKVTDSTSRLWAAHGGNVQTVV